MIAKWIPDRKVWASGLTYVVAFFIVQAFEAYTGADVPTEMEALLPGAIGYLVAYVVPPSLRDTIKRLDNEVIAIAARDTSVPAVSPAIAPIAETAAAIRQHVG